tara:strand:- start:5 stop:217 length:213 start_codon:yes stop_codon:yes gene_type:complete
MSTCLVSKRLQQEAGAGLSPMGQARGADVNNSSNSLANISTSSEWAVGVDKSLSEGEDPGRYKSKSEIDV